jgi:CRP/FNR family cyclic AMP-dependent transcriptional regulator
MAESLAELIGRHPVLEGLSPADVAQVAGCSHNLVAEVGEVLFWEGDPATTLYLVRRGQISLEVHAPGREPLLIETVSEGSVVGWSWLFPPYRWTLSGRVSAPLGAVAIDGSCLRGKAEADHELGYVLMRRFAAIMLQRLLATRLRLLDLYGDGSPS